MQGTTKSPGRDGPDGGALQDEVCVFGAEGDGRGQPETAQIMYHDTIMIGAEVYHMIPASANIGGSSARTVVLYSLHLPGRSPS